MKVSDDKTIPPYNLYHLSGHDLIDTVEENSSDFVISSSDQAADVRSMMARIVPLYIGLFNRGVLPDVLPIDITSGPEGIITERLRRLLRLEVLGETLISSILPKIRRRISFSTDRQYESHRLMLRGALHPEKTLSTNIQMIVSPGLMNLISQRPVRWFDTPENVFTVFVILKVLEDVDRLLQSPEITPHLYRKELAILKRLHQRCRFVLKDQIFKRLIPQAKNFQASPASVRYSLLGKVEARLRKRKRSEEGYSALVAWYRDYSTLELSVPGKLYTAPSRPFTPDKAYELLILMELLNGITEFGSVRQGNSDSKGIRGDYQCRFHDGSRWDIFVQSSAPLQRHRYFTKLAGIPDFVIRNPDTGSMIICDAKQYTTTSFGSGFFKMMGYLYQFGYPDTFSDIAGGLLFIPRSVSTEPDWMVWAGSGSAAHQVLATLTIPARGSVTPETKHAITRCVQYLKQILSKTAS